MNKLVISDSLSLPIDAVTQTFAILAKRGVGKSYTASVMAEEMLKAQQQIVAIDPTGAWHGLRSKFPIVIMGGEHGDVPLEESAGEVIANAIVENRFSAIIDLSLFRKGQMIRFMVAFAETLYRKNRQALHLFVDEADAVAPQAKNYGGDENRMLGAMEDIVRRGRKRGIGCTLITQRPAVLNKNVLTQCEILIALRLVHPKDIDAIKEWVNVHGDPAVAKEMIASLPSLPVGTAWFWAPGWGDIFEKVVIRKRETFDSGATPKPGESAQKPKHLAEVDLKQLGQQINATIEKIKSDDPKTLRAELAALRKQLKDRPSEQIEKTVEKIVEVPVLKNGQLERTEKIIGRMEEVFGKAVAEVAELRRLIAPAAAPRPARQLQVAARPAPIPRKIASAPSTHNGETSELGRGGKRKILIALAQKNGLTNKQIGVRAGCSSTSGTFGTYMGELRANEWIRDDGDRRFITDAGLHALGDYDPLPTGSELLSYWVRELGNGKLPMMLQVVAESYPDSLTNEQIGEAADISPTSGTFGTYMGRLRSLELIQGGRGSVKASDDLFD